MKISLWEAIKFLFFTFFTSLTIYISSVWSSNVSKSTFIFWNFYTITNFKSWSLFVITRIIVSIVATVTFFGFTFTVLWNVFLYLSTILSNLLTNTCFCTCILINFITQSYYKSLCNKRFAFIFSTLCIQYYCLLKFFKPKFIWFYGWFFFLHISL